MTTQAAFRSITLTCECCRTNSVINCRINCTTNTKDESWHREVHEDLARFQRSVRFRIRKGTQNAFFDGYTCFNEVSTKQLVYGFDGCLISVEMKWLGSCHNALIENDFSLLRSV